MKTGAAKEVKPPEPKGGEPDEIDESKTVEAPDDEMDLPEDPKELQALVRRDRAKLRRAEKKLEEAGLSRAEEKSLANEVAGLRAELKAKLEKLAEATGADTADDATAVVTDAAKGDEAPAEEDRGWRVTLL